MAEASLPDVLIYPNTELCMPEPGPAGSLKVVCRPFPFEGFDDQFCRPLPGFAENVEVTSGVGSVWLVTDCETGQRAEVLIAEEARDLNLFVQVNQYREALLTSGTVPKLADILGHMVHLGSKYEFTEPASTEQTKQWCSLAVVRDLGCLSIASPYPDR